MFMDTPKLQPISKSKPKTSEQQNVPSGSNSNTSGGTASSSKGGYGASSSTNTNNDNKPQNSGASSATVHDNNAGDIRHNNNSYRKNNCSPNPFQKPFNKPYFGDRSKERRNYYNNNNNSKHNNNPFQRGIWDDPPNVIRWQPNYNYNNNNRYRKFGHYNNSYHGNVQKGELNRLRENNTQFDDFDYPEDNIRTQFEDDKSSSSSSAINGDSVNNRKAHNSCNNSNNSNNKNKRTTDTNQNKKPELPKKPKSPKTPTKSCPKTTTSAKQSTKTSETTSLKSSSKPSSKPTPKQSPKSNTKSGPRNSPKSKERIPQLKSEEKQLQNKYTANNNSSAAETSESIVPISNEKIIAKNHNNRPTSQQSPKRNQAKSGPKNSPKSREKAPQLKSEEKQLQNQSTASNNSRAAETKESIASTSKEQIVAKNPNNKQTDITKQLTKPCVKPPPPSNQTTKAKPPRSPFKGNFKNRSPKQARKPLAKKTINIVSGSGSETVVAEANNTVCHKRKFTEVLNTGKSEEPEFSLNESLPSIYVVNNITSSSSTAAKKQKISEEFTGEEAETTDNILGIANPIKPCEKPVNVKQTAAVSQQISATSQSLAKPITLCEQTIANVKQTAIDSQQISGSLQSLAKPITVCENTVVNVNQTAGVSQQLSAPSQSLVNPITLSEEIIINFKPTAVVTREQLSEQPTNGPELQVTPAKNLQLLPEHNNKPQTADNLNTHHKEFLCAKQISSQDIEIVTDTIPSTVTERSEKSISVNYPKTVDNTTDHPLSICENEVIFTPNSSCDIPNPFLSLSSLPLPTIIQTNNGISQGNSKPTNQQQPTDLEYILQRMTQNLHTPAQQEPAAKENRIEIDTINYLEHQPSSPPPSSTTAAAVLTANLSTGEDEHNVHHQPSAEFQLPKISLIPLSRLIASEYWEDVQSVSNAADEVSLCDITPKIVTPTTTPPQRHVFKPNLVKRKRNVSTCSNTSTTSNPALPADPIVDKLAAMNKINLKNIINSSDTKYDKALQQQARKRLREGIRHQLRSLNVEPNIVGHKETHIADFAPDEIVDSINLPDFLLDQIRNAFALSNSEEDQIHLNTVTKELLSLSPEATAAKQLETAPDFEVLTASNATQLPETPSEGADLTETPVIQLETPAERALSPATAIQLLETPLEPEVSPPDSNMVNLDNRLTHNGSLSSGRSQPTSSSRSNISNGIKPEDHVGVTVKREMLEETTTPHTQHKDKTLRKHKKSRKSSKKKKSKSPKLLEDIIVLDSSSNSSGNSSSSSASSTSSSTSSSSSSDSESDTSKRSSSSAIKRKRLKLKVDAENVVDSFEKLILPSLSERLQERYRSKHSNSTHTKLHFISCICVSDYNSEKFSKLEIAKIQRNLKSTDCSMALEFLMREIVNVFSKQKQVAKENEAAKPSSPSNTKSKEQAGKSTLPEKQATPAAKTLESAPGNIIADLDSENAIQKCVSKVLSLYRQEMKAAVATQQTAAPALVTSATTTTPVAAPLNASTPAPPQSAAKALQHDDSDTTYKASNGIKLHHKDEPAQQHLNRITQLQRETENQFNHIRSLTSLSSSDYSLTLPIDTTSMRFNSTIFDFPTTSYRQPPTFPPLDLETLKKQSPIGEAVVNNLREIDVKLMELHKRKMYIEEMILKLQKDKMDTDLLTIKLQNEKFILLNTAMTANVTNSTTTNTSGATKEKMEAAVPPVTAAPINCAETVVNVKNIKTETVVIPDDDDDRPKIQCTPLAQLTKNVVQPDSAATNPEPLQTIPPKEVILPVANNAHITSSSSSSRKTKRKSTSEAINIGETFKKLREKAQKVKSMKRAQQQTNAITEIHSSSNGSGDDDASSSSTAQNQRPANTNEELNNITSSKNGPATPDYNTTSQTVVNLTANATEPEKAQNHNLMNGVKPTKTSPRSAAAAAAILSRLTSEVELSILTKPSRVPVNVDASSDSAIVVEDVCAEKLFDLKNMRLGLFKGLSSPIAQVRLYENIVIASSESGKIFTFDANTLELMSTYNKHTEAITQTFLCEAKGFLFTTSLDGYFKKSLLKNLSCGTQSVYLKEPLQTLDIQWDMAFIGSRWGNIYTCNIMANIGSATQLCATDSSIITIKAAKEGPRKVLIVTSKGNLLHVRDASSGLLLRTFDVPDCINVYSILLNEGILYCGTQKKEIRKYEFVSGAPQGSITCGNGAVSMLMFRNKYMFVGCYDGYIYILDKETGRQITRLAGSGKMILTIEIVGDKIITSAKDCTMKVISIPTYCLGNSL